MSCSGSSQAECGALLIPLWWTFFPFCFWRSRLFYFSERVLCAFEEVFQIYKICNLFSQMCIKNSKLLDGSLFSPYPLATDRFLLMSIKMTMLGRNVYSPSAPLIRTTHHLHQNDQIEDHLSISRSQAADVT